VVYYQGARGALNWLGGLLLKIVAIGGPIGAAVAYAWSKIYRD
jgi:hypothetical protein